MPDDEGEDEVLAATRERGFARRVAVVTAVDPDLDDYLTKPVTG